MIKKIAMRIHKNSSEIRAFCCDADAENIFIYGAGLTGSLIYQYLKEENIKISAFIVSDGERRGNSIDGVAVKEFSEIKLSMKDRIIVALGTKLSCMIYEMLLASGIEANNIYCQDIYNPVDVPPMVYSSLIDGNHRDDLSDNGFFASEKELDEIGKRCGTDKSSLVHNYLNKYDFFLSKIKHSEIKVLELGIQKGKSLQMWAEYFKKAVIYGVDIDDSCKRFERDNIVVLIQDLGDEDRLDTLADLRCNVVIDDASHMWSHQIKSICHIIPKMPSGGIFIMEDLETSFPSYRYYPVRDASISAYQFCRALSNVVCGRERLNIETCSAIEWELRDELEKIASQLEMISFIHGSCIMIKR